MKMLTTHPVSHIESESDDEQTTDFLNSLLDLVRDDAAPLYFACFSGWRSDRSR
jgi:hypothetical protein